MKKFKFAIFEYNNSNVCAISFYQKNSEKKNLEKLRDFGDIEPIDPKSLENVLKNLKICDLGNYKFKDFDEIYQKSLSVINDNKIPIIFSCNHLTTLFSLGICNENSGILIFDAHADLKNFYKSKYSRATWLRRFLDLVDSERIFLVGIRSIDEDEKEFLKNEKINFLTTFEIKEKLKNSISKIKDFLNSFDNIYISFDVDVMDSYIINSNFPEAFGLDMYDVYKIVNSFENVKIVGMDFVEFLIKEKKDAINLVSILFQFLKKIKL